MVHGIELDRSRYPLVVMRSGMDFIQSDWDELMKGMTQLIRAGPFGLINDIRGSRMPDAVQRRAITQMYVDYEHETRAHLLASGVVGDSRVVNGVITALNWLKPTPHPFKVFSTFIEAERWVLQHFSHDLRRQVMSQSIQGAAG
ncbi:hypothetical protein WME97_21680 [Sorangium sp. So ce367]|uniref:hypothetical protein n=1 Tax=Sorangium sp. So ce367 TaxID=3133305 RepID=UPI003F5DBC97